MAVVAVLAAGPLTSSANEAKMPPERFALVLGRLLAYDVNLNDRARGAVVIAVLVDPKSPGSDAAAAQMAGALKTLERVTIRNLPVKTEALPLTDDANLEKAVKERHISAFVVMSGLDKYHQAIQAISRKAKVVTVATSAALVKLGFSAAISLQDGGNKIFVNLAATKEEGAAFGADLLRLSEVIP